MKALASRRVLSLVMAVVMMMTFLTPVIALDDFSALQDVFNATDYGDNVEASPPIVIDPNNPVNSDGTIGESSDTTDNTPSNSTSSRDEIYSSSSESSSSNTDTGGDEESSSSSSHEDNESALASEQEVPASQDSNGLIPDGYSFVIPRPGQVLDSGMAYRSSGGTTIYLQIDNSIQHRYPFKGGNSIYPAYIFTTGSGEAAYCIEPAKWNSVNNDVVTGDVTYSKLSASKQQQIAKAVAANSSGAGNHASYMACQAIIWQIVYGESFGSGSVYDAVIAANSAKLSAPYQSIISKMNAGGEIPSFMSSDMGNPNVYEMTSDGGQWSISLENTNSNVKLNASDFKSREPLQFKVSGNTLTVTSATEPGTDSFTEWHSGGGGGTGLVFWMGSKQDKVSGGADFGGMPADGYMAFNPGAIPPEEETPDPAPPQEEDGLGYLQINKYDGKTNLPLGGAVFRVETDAGFVNDAFPVEHGGSTIVIPIPAGQDSVQATVTEKVAPDGYSMDTTPKTVTVTKGDSVNIAHVSFANYPLECSLTIYKYETGNQGIALQGASFRIRYADPSVSAQTWTQTTDASGKIKIDLPAAGALIVEELSAPAGYVMSSKTMYDITVEKGEHKQLDVPNDKRAQLIVVKKDAQTGQLLAGATIKATLLRSHTPPYEQNISYTRMTQADGRAIFDGLIPGEWRIEEQSPPQYYLPTSVVHTVSIFEGNTTPVEVVFENEPWAGITVKKVDGTNDKGLQGAVFKVYKGAGEDPLAYLGDFESNENGIVVIPKVETNQYYTIVEAQPPYGYLIDEEHRVQTVMVRPDAVNNNVTVIFRNPPRPKLLIQKIDEKTGEKLPGAVFRVSLKDSAEYKEFTTGPDGTVLIENLEEDWYSVVEIRSPTNYILDSSIHNIQTKAGETTILSINNHRKPNLLIRKVDEQTGEGIPNVTLRVTKDGAKEYQDIVTGPDGTFTLEHVEPGWYIIVEQRVPENYILDQTPHYIEVKQDEDTEIVIKNRMKPSLKIVKTDSVTKQPMQGVLFEISLKEGKTLGEFLTDANGEIFLPNVDPNQIYVIREVKTLDGYLIDTQVKEANIEWGKTTVVPFTNTPKNPILIYKVDYRTGEPLGGAKFLVEKVNGEHVGEYITGRNGYATVTGVEPGFYVVKEVEPPLNYILDETPQTVELKYDEPAIVRFEDKPLSGLHIKKIDSLTKEPLEGVSFRVSEKDGRTIGEFKTDAQGSILIDTLQPGWYTIRETRTLPNYILDETPKDVEFIWGQLITVEFTNDRKTQLNIKKVDASDGTPLANAKFRLETVGGEFIGEYSTDRTGFISVDGLITDYVVVREIEAPDGYLLDNTPHTVKIEANKPSILELSNKKLSPIQIKKIDEETGEPLAGALFRITRANGEFIGEYTSGKDGFINVPELSPGHYIVSEQRSPEGYLLDNTPKTIEVKSNVPTLVEFTNKKMPGVQVQKLDKITNLPIGGAKFRVEKMNGELVGDFQTNSAGFFVVPDVDLNNEWLTIYETQAPAGYILDPTPQNVQMKPGKTSIVQFFNQPLMGLQIQKRDSVTQKPMAGVQFRISELDGRLIQNVTTDEAGLCFIPDLKANTWVVIEETKTLPGYKLDNAPRNVEIKGDKLNVVLYENTPYPNLVIKKIDSETGAPLSDVKFKLFDKQNRELGTFTTNQLGQIHLTGMDEGHYFLQEVQAKPGYVLDKTVREVNLYWGKTTTIEIKNTAMGTLRIKKIDSITGQPIFGVTFNLYDTKNNLLGEFTTNNMGIIEFPSTITAGVYLLKEVSAPDNYVVDSIPKTIKIKSGETLELVIENKPVQGKIQIIKKSADYNDTTKLKAGAFLEGAVFEIFDSTTNEVVERITTDSRGIANSKELPAGKVFGIREITAPKYYMLNEQVFYAEIKKPDDLIKFEVLDESEELGVDVQKFGNIECLPGDIIRYDFANIRNTSNVPLDEFYFHDELPVDAVQIMQISTGTYNERLTYEVQYKTNMRPYRTLEDGLSTGANNTIDCDPETLRLREGEYVTDIKFEFGTVQPGFVEETPPFVLCLVNSDLPNEYRFDNRCDVGGKSGDEWVIAKDSWITVTWAKPEKLPKTGK